MINVWTDDKKRLEHVQRLMLTDKSFDLDTLSANPLYKPVYDKIVKREQQLNDALDASTLWSRHYTRLESNHFFLHPLVLSAVLIALCLGLGVRQRLYRQAIQKGRRLEFADRLDIDLDDLDAYPRAAVDALVEQRKAEARQARDEEKMQQTEASFHEFAEGRLMSLGDKRRRRGLRVAD